MTPFECFLILSAMCSALTLICTSWDSDYFAYGTMAVQWVVNFCFLPFLPIGAITVAFLLWVHHKYTHDTDASSDSETPSPERYSFRPKNFCAHETLFAACIASAVTHLLVRAFLICV